MGSVDSVREATSAGGEHLYNARIFQNYLEYLQRYYPHTDRAALLREAGIAEHEVADRAHYLTQAQVNRFHSAVRRHVDDPDLPRKVGNYAVSSASMGSARKFSLGLFGPKAAYLALDHAIERLSRAARLQSRSLGRRMVEVVSTPKSGVVEQPFQCENRWGTLESIAGWFTGRPATIVHPECVHAGASRCRYVVSWQRYPAERWRVARNLVAAAGVLVSAAMLALSVAPAVVLTSALTAAVATVAMGWRAESCRVGELERSAHLQGEAYIHYTNEVDTRYRHSRLAQQIGRAVSCTSTVRELGSRVIDILRERADFDLAALYLADEAREHLHLVDSFGTEGGSLAVVTPCAEQKSPLLHAFRLREPVSLDSERAGPCEFLRRIDATDCVCAPLLYEDEALGVLLVGSRGGNTPTQTSVSLLEAIAANVAVSIANTRTFDKLRKNEISVLENSPFAVLLIDTNTGRVLFANSAFVELTGYDAAAFPETRDFQATCCPNLLLDAETLETWRSACTIDEVVRPFPLTDRAGDQKPIEITPVFLADGQVVLMMVDLTERRQMQRRLAQADRLASVGVLAAGVAHEINNPLAYVLGNLEYLASVLPTLAGESPDAASTWQETTDCIAEAIDGAVRVRNIVRNLKTFAGVREEEATLVRADVVMDKAISLANNQIKYKARLVRQYDPVRPVLVSEGRLCQVLVNLLVNAAQAIEEGDAQSNEIRVAVASAGEDVIVRVRDTGAGISPERLDRIFDPFFTTKGPREGSGLGLAISHSIVTSYGGTIDVDSVPGGGSTFVVTLPAARATAPAAGRADAHAQAPPPSTRRRRILVIDDEPMVATAVARALRAEHEVVVANGGSEGRDLLAGDTGFDLVLCDLIMPDVTGADLYEWLEASRPELTRRVVFLTGGAFTQRSEEFLARVGNRVVDKPISIANLRELIHEVSDAA